MKLILVTMLLSLTACGRSQGIKVQMEPIHAAATYKSIKKLEKDSGLNFQPSENPAIIIQYSTNEDLAWFSNNILGLAEIDENPCKISIAERTFQASQDLLDSVVWHEIGHCYDLPHSHDSEDIMYYLASPLSAYSTDVINNFFRRLYEKTN